MVQQAVDIVEDVPIADLLVLVVSAELIEAVGEAAMRWSFPLVVDPVMMSKQGAALAGATV